MLGVDFIEDMEGVSDGIFHGLQQNDDKIFIGLIELMELIVLEDVGEIEFEVLELHVEVVDSGL